MCSVAQSRPTLCTPWDLIVAHQAPLSTRFPRQEYWSGFPFPSPADLPNPGTKPTSPALAGRFFTWEDPKLLTRLLYFCNQETYRSRLTEISTVSTYHDCTPPSCSSLWFSSTCLWLSVSRCSLLGFRAPLLVSLSAWPLQQCSRLRPQLPSLSLKLSEHCPPPPSVMQVIYIVILQYLPIISHYYLSEG